MPRPLDPAQRALSTGGLVVYPTDTLLGLGARAVDPRAVRRLFEVKERPLDLPLSVGVSSLEEVEPLARMDPRRRAIARRAFPGPFTLLLPASARARRDLAQGIVSASGAIGIRVPDHPVARALARSAGPIVATSANRHGHPPCASIAAARREFGDRVAVYLPAVPRPSGRPSTVVDLTGPAPRVLRGA